MRISLEALTAVLACLSTGYALQVSPDTPLSELISSAKAQLAKGSPRDALVYFDAAVSRDPTNYVTIFQRGAAYLSIGKNLQASEDFNRVLELKPDFEGALLQRSRLQARSAHWKEALRDLERAGKKASAEYKELEEAQEAATLAVAAEKKGDWEACVSQAGIAIMKASTDLALRQTRARCRFERGEVQEGVSDLAHVLQISPSLVEPHLQMSSMLFYALGDSDRGLAQIRKCLHADPDSKPCNRLYKQERQVAKSLGKLHGALEARKFSNAVKLLVGDGDESGLIADVKADVANAREMGHIHHAASNNLYVFLIEKTCEAYREVCRPYLPFLSLSLSFVALSILTSNIRCAWSRKLHHTVPSLSSWFRTPFMVCYTRPRPSWSRTDLRRLYARLIPSGIIIPSLKRLRNFSRRPRCFLSARSRRTTIKSWVSVVMRMIAQSSAPIVN